MSRRNRKTASIREQAIKMSTPLMIGLRPMTIADMVPGQQYEPGMSILIVTTVPGIVNGRDPGYAIEVPMLLPEKYRSQTPENTMLALHYLRALEPAVYEDVVRHARAARALAAAKLCPSSPYAG